MDSRSQPVQIYRLLSGKISRSNSDGVMETHKSPYEFVPTESELRANRWRMVTVAENPESMPVSTFVPPSMIVERKHDTQGKKADQIGIYPNTVFTEKQGTVSSKYTETMTNQVLTTETRTPEQIRKDTTDLENARKKRTQADLSALLAY